VRHLLSTVGEDPLSPVTLASLCRDQLVLGLRLFQGQSFSVVLLERRREPRPRTIGTGRGGNRPSARGMGSRQVMESQPIKDQSGQGCARRAFRDAREVALATDLEGLVADVVVSGSGMTVSRVLLAVGSEGAHTDRSIGRRPGLRDANAGQRRRGRMT